MALQYTGGGSEGLDFEVLSLAHRRIQGVSLDAYLLLDDIRRRTFMVWIIRFTAKFLSFLALAPNFPVPWISNKGRQSAL